MKKITMMVASAVCIAAQAKIDMGTPFTDGVVLQRDRAVPVWGSATAGKTVTVEFAGKSVSATAGEDGKWKVELPSMPASKENRIMRVNEVDNGNTVDSVEIKNVLVGEVWFCSGQSNTDCPIWGGAPRYRDGWGAMMLLSTTKPFVRLVKNPHMASLDPKFDYKADWMEMTPAMYDRFKKGKRMPSAMGYYFALELANALDIPIGIIDSSWGGTNIDAWTPVSGYEKVPSLKDILEMERYDAAKFKVAQEEGKFKNVYGRKAWFQQRSALWNGMVAAYAPMACRGFIWYQGCHNSGEPQRYADKMHALYNGWSKEFANPDLKLYFVQLAPFTHNWIGIVAAQNKFAEEEKNAGLVVASDVGNFADIHPNDKRTIGKRLSLLALKRDYGFEKIKADAPTFKSVTFAEGKAEISFNNVESLYIYDPSRSTKAAFEIAGADDKWYAATIENVLKDGPVKGKTIILSAKEVPEPVKVRYMHKKRTMGTVYNEACLPLGPFEGK